MANLTMPTITTTPSPASLPDALVAQGRYTATTEELLELTGTTPGALRAGLSRLRAQGKIFSPARHFYVVVPPEFRAWRVVPADWFIDSMMRHLERDYYVAFLSAAAIHGASHQAPQVFQVITSRPLPDRDIERVRLRFTTSDRVHDLPTERKLSHTGEFTVATRETTAVDLAWRPSSGAGLSNVATVLIELGELDGDALARAAELRGRAAARRLGWLLERYRSDVDLHWLRVVARPDEGDLSLLSPGSRKRGPADRRWGVRLNTEVEPDL